MDTAEKVVAITAASRLVYMFCSYCWLVSMMAAVPSPSHEVIQSMDERPGKLNSGRITLLMRLPVSSNRPKSSSNGSSKPANKNTDNSVGMSSFNTSPPVYSCQINSGPTPFTVITAKTAPSTLKISHG